MTCSARASRSGIAGAAAAGGGGGATLDADEPEGALVVSRWITGVARDGAMAEGPPGAFVDAGRAAARQTMSGAGEPAGEDRGCSARPG
ncbi:MAG TPA: hypothetical protein VND93_29035, partial [Myxococcales bacterium]|nr:hypothetical protein [Myxococcales bacterium]